MIRVALVQVLNVLKGFAILAPARNGAAGSESTELKSTWSRSVPARCSKFLLRILQRRSEGATCYHGPFAAAPLQAAVLILAATHLRALAGRAVKAPREDIYLSAVWIVSGHVCARREKKKRREFSPLVLLKEAEAFVALTSVCFASEGQTHSAPL